MTDWTSPVDRRHAVWISYLGPDILASLGPADQPGNSFHWRGPSHQLGFGVMAAPTMDSLLKMVHSGLPGLAELGLSPEYLIGATAAGAAALQGGTARHLSVADMVFLRTDEQVQAWVLSCSVDPLDLLVVVQRPVADLLCSPENPARGGRRSLRRRGQRGNTREEAEPEPEGQPEGELAGGLGGPAGRLEGEVPEGEPEGEVEHVFKTAAPQKKLLRRKKKKANMSLSVWRQPRVGCYDFPFSFFSSINLSILFSH